MNNTDSSDNKIRIDHFDIKQSIVWQNHFNYNKYDSQTPSNNKDNSEDGNHHGLDNSQYLDGLKLDKTVNHEDQVILIKGSYNSISVSVTGLTNVDTYIPSLFLLCLNKIQGLSLQYLHKTIITILCLHCLYETHIYSCTSIIIATSVSANVSTWRYSTSSL